MTGFMANNLIIILWTKLISLSFGNSEAYLWILDKSGKTEKLIDMQHWNLWAFEAIPNTCEVDLIFPISGNGDQVTFVLFSLILINVKLCLKSI